MEDMRDDMRRDGTTNQEFVTVLNKFRKLMGKMHGNHSLYPGEFMMLGAISHSTGRHREVQEETDEVNSGGDDKGACFKHGINMDMAAPGIRVSELSKISHSTKSATSKMLKGLEEKGYITRITDTKDRRVVYICLTEAGNEIINESIKKMQKFTDRTIQKMGEEDTKSLVIKLNKFYDTMVEVMKESGRGENL